MKLLYWDADGIAIWAKRRERGTFEMPRVDAKRDGPAAFLKDYRGYLQADAFSGYDGIYLESDGRIIEVGCWARAPLRSSGPVEVPREPSAGFSPHGNGAGLDW